MSRLLPSPCFKPELRKAIRDGRKTQTRRVIVPQPTRTTVAGQTMWSHPKLGGDFGEHVFGPCFVELAPCPHGVVGDRWYLREPLKRIADCVCYADDQDLVMVDGEAVAWRWQRDRLPQIHLPRVYARTFLELTELRVERVRDISVADALAEGVDDWDTQPDPRTGEPMQVQLNPIEEFANLWDRINAGRGYGWAANPWVFVYGFKLISREEALAA